MLKAAMIGAGGRATRAHYPALADADDVSLEAVCDLDPERLAHAGDTYDIPRRYTDYHRMLDEVDCDVVYAVMQPYHVCQVAVDALDAGKHVMVEKPPGAHVPRRRLRHGWDSQHDADSAALPGDRSDDEHHRVGLERRDRAAPRRPGETLPCDGHSHPGGHED